MAIPATAIERLEAVLERVFEAGFDRSYLSDDGQHVRVRCSQCNAVSVNGNACHEVGCPNEARVRREAEARERAEEVPEPAPVCPESPDGRHWPQITNPRTCDACGGDIY